MSLGDAPAGHAAVETRGGYTIRDITDYDEMRTCVAIQERTWGPAFAEIVPAAILWVAAKTGGVVAGGFDADGGMAGFVFGLTGYRDGRPIHWSDMLAVLPEARGAGLGRALKAWQRNVLLERGVREAFWTFDPLESRNAHLNFARLGAIAREYVPDCYGVSRSPLHAGLATDRLIACWPLDAPRVRERMEGRERRPDGDIVAGLPLINAAGHDVTAGLEAPTLRLRIPADIQGIRAADMAAARRWRETVRRALLHYLGRGYVVVDLVREGEEWSSYLLAREDAAQAALSL